MSLLNALKELFGSACSQQQEIARAADVQLSRLSKEQGFYPAVAELVADNNTDPGVRLQAVLYLKNAIDNIWISKNRDDGESSSTIADHKKDMIRCAMLRAYTDCSKQVNIHVAVVISKIARFDCPQNWPQLLPHLANAIDSSVANSDVTTHERALFILYSLIKTLAARRLPPGKRIFHALCCELFDPLYRYWKAHVSQAEVYSASSASAVLCLKALRYMVLYGFAEPSDIPAVSDFLTSLAPFVQNVVQLAASATEERKEQLHKIILVSLKLVLEFQEQSPLQFVSWLPAYLELSSECAFGVFSSAMPVLVHVRSINILKMVLLCQDYRGSSKLDSSSVKGRQTAQAVDLCTLFFSKERVCAFCQALVERYLVLTPEDLDSWRDEPETYATREDSEAWRHMIRPAAESFLLSLIHECWEHVLPLSSQWLQVVGSPLDFQNVEQVLSRDAVLTSVGIASNDLNQELDFDAIFTNICLPLMGTSPDSDGQSIIQRRVIWLCGKWIDVKFSKECKPQLYETLIRITGKQNEDMVIRLTACQTLKRAVDEYEFDLDSFRPYLNDAVTALINLLQSCRESDAQMNVVTTLWLLAERAGRLLAGNVGAIVAYVPSLWASENVMLKGQILNLFTQLVKSLGSECHVLMDGLCAMLETVLNAEDHVYLLEEGLDLWLALVENSQSPLPPQLMALFRFIPRLLTIQTENLRVCCDIVKSYCVYRSPDFAEAYLRQLGTLYRSMIGEMRSEGIISVLKVVEMIIRCFGQGALASFSDVIIWCIETLMASQETVSVLVMCVALISMVSVHNVQQLYGFMATRMNEEQVADFLKKWLGTLDLMSHHDLDRRKCCGLGLCTWITIPIRAIELVFPDIISALVNILFDVCIEENGAYIDSLVAYDFGVCCGVDETTGFLETEHDKRSQQLRDIDPVYTVSMQTQVTSAIEARKKLCIVEPFEALWMRVDSDTAINLKKMCTV